MLKLVLLGFALSIVLPEISIGQSTEKASTDKATLVSTQPINSWRIAEDSDRQSYEINLDETIYRSGVKSASIKLRDKIGDPSRKASLMQTIRADAYRNKRMRLSAFLKSENVENAGLWFRIDGESMQVLGLDNMGNRPVKGTTDWSKYEMVVDVPVAAQQIVFGAFLKGAGQIWVDDLSFDEVGQDVSVSTLKPQEVQVEESARYIETYKSKNREAYEKQLKRFHERNTSAPVAPANLDFESF